MLNKFEKKLILLLKTNIVPLLLILFVLSVYIHNLSRSVYGGDVGDMITSAAVGGVAHAPGYPLFTFLGFLLTRINFLTPAFMVGLISVISSCLALVIFYKFALEVTKSKFMALLSSSILAFNYLFWFYSEIAEVFALNSFFVVVIIYLSYLVYKYKRIRDFYFLSFFVGLSATNHQTIIFIYPLALIMSIPLIKKLKIYKNPKTVLKLILVALLGFSVYLYVPIAAHFNPPVNWDRVKDLNSFLHLLLRKDYGTFNSGSGGVLSLAQRGVVVKLYLFDVITQLSMPVIFLCLLGFLRMLLKNRSFSLMLLLSFLFSGPLFIAYAGFPIISSFFLGIYERFFIMSSVIVMFFFPFGLKYFIDILNNLLKRKDFQNLFVGVFFIIPITLFIYNFPKTDLHNVFIGDNIAYDLLSPLPKNSVIFIGGDTVLFNTWYVNLALNYRKDVRVVNVNGVAGDSYMDQVKAKYLQSHPKDKNDPNLNIKVIEEIHKTNPVYSYSAIEPSKGDNLFWVPQGLLFKLVNSKEEIPLETDYLKSVGSIWKQFNYQKENQSGNIALGSYSIADIPSLYAQALLTTGNFMLTQYSDRNQALAFYKRALDISPDYYRTSVILGAFYYDQKDCSKANDFFTKAIGLYPFDQNTYYLMYANYRLCFKDAKKSQEVAKEYNQVFKSDFFKDIKSFIKEENTSK